MSSEKKKFDSMGRDVSTAWVINPHGMKSSTYQYIADEFVSTRPGWKYAEPDFVPEKKVYSMDGDFNKQGLERRLAILGKEKAIAKQADEESEDEEEGEPEEGEPEVSFKELQKKAKDAGIATFGLSKAKLQEKLSELNN